MYERCCFGGWIPYDLLQSYDIWVLQDTQNLNLSLHLGFLNRLQDFDDYLLVVVAIHADKHVRIFALANF